MTRSDILREMRRMRHVLYSDPGSRVDRLIYADMWEDLGDGPAAAAQRDLARYDLCCIAPSRMYSAMLDECNLFPIDEDLYVMDGDEEQPITVLHRHQWVSPLAVWTAHLLLARERVILYPCVVYWALPLLPLAIYQYVEREVL